MSASQQVRTIEIRDYPEQRVLKIRERVHMKDLPARIPVDIREIHEYLRSRSVTPVGAPHLQCPEPDASGMVEVEVGWPIDRDVPPRGRIERGTLPAGRAAWTLHVGSYDTVDKTYAALYRWIAEHGHAPAGPARELYVTGPEVTDPSKIVTEIVAPIR